jgi:nitronate monooxygenase
MAATRRAPTTWPDRRLCDLLSIEHPLVQAPMAGAMDADLVVAACEGGALGSLPCALLDVEQARAQIADVFRRTRLPFNVNFFCHASIASDADRETRWRRRLAPYYDELGIDSGAVLVAAKRMPFDDAMCALIEEMKPPVVSFHFGLPDASLLARVRATGARVLASATTVDEALWLEAKRADVIIAQGAEAGGHRGMFLAGSVDTQAGTFALVPQIVDAVRVPVIAAGGIADARGIAAAFALGASGAQIGTAYLRCPESKISALFRAALANARADATAITNVMTGKPARGIMNRLMREIGTLSDDAPPFPHAATALGPLRAASEQRGLLDFTPAWSGQAASLAREMPAAELTRMLARTTLERLSELAP